MQLSDEGRRRVWSFEGCVLRLYRDVAGVWTIGRGHALTRREIESNVFEGRTLSIAEADAIFDDDMDPVVAAVNTWLDGVPPKSQAQFDCVCSLAYNEGIFAIAGSTMLRFWKAGMDEQAADQFLAWNKISREGADGVWHLVECPILTARRGIERRAFLAQTITAADVQAVAQAQYEALRIALDSDDSGLALIHRDADA